MKILFVFIALFSTFQVFSQQGQKRTVISEDLELIRLTEHSYVHVSWFQSPEFGRFPSNGMVFIKDGEAFLFDTPMTDSLTMMLLSYLQDSLKIKIVGFVTNDWHGDSMGGLERIKKSWIPSYANELTREIAASKGLPVPEYGFKDSLTLLLGDEAILCRFHGAAHTMDNIVVWIPSEKILFADCMVKEIRSVNLGFTGDGDTASYPATLAKVKSAYPDAKIVIPGHGDPGGLELIDHTIKLAQKK